MKLLLLWIFLLTLYVEGVEGYSDYVFQKRMDGGACYVCSVLTNYIEYAVQQETSTDVSNGLPSVFL